MHQPVTLLDRSPDEKPTSFAFIEAIDHSLTVRELAKLLSVSVDLIYDQMKAGGLPSFKVGYWRRFDPKAVADWLRQHSVSTKE